MKGGQLRKSLKLRLFVSGRPSNFVGLTLLPRHGNGCQAF